MTGSSLQELDQNGAGSDSSKSVKSAITVSGVVKKFGKTTALDGLSMNIPTGSVYALLGRNGAGKSTLVQLLMAMMDRDSGTISVLGHDPAKEPEALKQRVGYIPDRLPMYDWMTVAEVLKFTSAFYERWSREEEIALVKRFGLNTTQKVSSLSRGYRALLALVIAMAHNPDIVLLDECTSGMDAIARREFERSVIEALQQSGRTVLFVGHQIDEMERICDHVGIIKDGKMLIEMPLDQLKDTVKLLRITGEDNLPTNAPGCRVIEVKRIGREQLVKVELSKAGVMPTLPPGLMIQETVNLSLEEIFVALLDIPQEAI